MYAPLTWGIYNQSPSDVPACGFIGELCPPATRGMLSIIRFCFITQKMDITTCSTVINFRQYFVVSGLCVCAVGVIDDKNGDVIYVDNTPIIVASSVVGGVAFIVLIFAYQFVRYEDPPDRPSKLLTKAFCTNIRPLLKYRTPLQQSACQKYF